ncbi:MAG: DUF3054 domain-containing protein [Actinomycetota bacterium]
MKGGDRRTISPRILLIGDAIAIALFAVIGLASHDEGITAGGVARNALPILAGWFVVAAFVGTYSRPGLRTMLITWVMAVPVGVVIRAIVLSRPADGSQIVFAIVTMTVTLVLLLGWRAIAAMVPAGR